MPKSILDLLSETEQVNHNSDKNISELVRRIKKGETTGNAIKDYIIANYHVLEQKSLEKKLAMLENDVNNNQGEQFLIIEREDVTELGGCMSGADNYRHIYVNQKFGIIKGVLNFDCKNGLIRFPMNPFVEEKGYYHGWKLQHENPVLGCGDVGKLNTFTDEPWQEMKDELLLHDYDGKPIRRIIKTIVGKDAIHWYICHPFIWQNENVKSPNKNEIAKYVAERDFIHPHYKQALETLHIQYQK